MGLECGTHQAKEAAAKITPSKTLRGSFSHFSGLAGTIFTIQTTRKAEKADKAKRANI